MIRALVFVVLVPVCGKCLVQPSSSADAGCPGCLKTKTNMTDLVKSSAPKDEKSSRPTVPNNIFTYFAYFNIIKTKKRI